MLHFIHLSGARAGGVDQVDDDEMVLGRDAGCAVRFHPERDTAVSKRHAEVRRINGRYVLTDLDSRNGTYVNGRLVKEVFLRHGDVIRLGADGPQVKVDASGKAVTSILRAMRARRWRVVWIPVALMGLAGLAIGVILLTRVWGRTVQTIEEQKASLDGEIDALMAVLDDDPGGMDRLEDLASRYDRLVQLEAEASAVAARLQGVGGGDEDTPMDVQIRTVLGDFGEPTYRIPPSLRDAIRTRIGSWLGTAELDRTWCEIERHVPAMRPVLARYSFPEVLSFLPWVLSPGDTGGDAVGLWAIGSDEGRRLGLIDGDVDLREDPLESTEAIVEQLQQDLLALNTSSVLLATAARDPGLTSVVETLREEEQWTRGRRCVRFLWLAGLLDEDQRERIPRLVAAAVIGRHPDHYGLSRESCSFLDDPR